MAALDFPNAPTPGQVYDKWTWNGTVWALTAAGSVPATIPTGVIWDYGGTTLPSGWLWCDGSTYTDLAQPKLSGAIGRTFTAAGVPAGSFQVPDLRKRSSVGADAGEPAVYALGKAGGQRNSELAAHAHVIPTHGHGMTGNSGNDLANHHHDIGGLLTGVENAPHGHNSAGGFTGVMFHDTTGYNSGYAIPLTQNSGGSGLSPAVGALAGPTANHTHTLVGQTGGPNQNHVHGLGTLAVANQTEFPTQSTKSPSGGDTYVDKNLSPYLAVNKIIYTGN